MTWPNPDQLNVLIFDAVIAIGVVGVPTWLYFFWRYRRFKRLRPWMRLAVTALLTAGWAVLLWGSFVEPRLLAVRHVAVDLRHDRSAAPARTLRLAVLSDTHLGFYKGEAWLASVIERIKKESPDAVLLAGDVVSSPEGIEQLGPWRGIEPPLGKFAALGNWDYHVGAVEIRRALGSQGVQTLINRSVEVGGLRLVGIDSVIYGRPQWDKALADVEDGEPVVVLAHDPDAALWAAHFGADLTIAGHTHGGQLRLPWRGPVGDVPTRLGRAYDEGLFDFYGSKLLITSGVGESGVRARLFNPPEIILLEVAY
jgi:predicted MPP superfamily phosphohydrolase